MPKDGLTDSVFPAPVFKRPLLKRYVATIRANIVPLLSLLTILLCLLPLVVPDQQELVPVGPLQHGLDSTSYKLCLIVSLALAAQWAIDTGADACTGHTQHVTRLVLVGNILMHDLLVLLLVVPSHNVRLLWSLVAIRDFVYTAGITYLLHRRHATWSDAAVLTCLGFFCSAILCRLFSYHIVDVETPAGVFSLSLWVMSCCVYSFNAYGCVRQLICTPGGLRQDPLLVMYACMLIAWFVLTFILNGVFGVSAVGDMTPTQLVAYESVATGCTLIATVLHNRLAAGEHARSSAIADVLRMTMETKRLFVRYVSHELRTPINTVSLGLSLLQHIASAPDDEETDPRDALFALRAELSSLAASVIESSETAVHILDDLLTYEKIEGDMLTLNCRIESGVPLILHAARPLAVQARQAGLELVVEVDPALGSGEVWLNVDVPKISQIIRNLLSNAIKYSAAGCLPSHGNTAPVRKVRVTAMAVQLGGHSARRPAVQNRSVEHCSADKATHFRVEVTDVGVGLTAAEQALLFRSFVQFNPNQLETGGGAGLGLYISHKIAAKHGGTLTVHSDGLGSGSTFTLDLPVHVMHLQGLTQTPLSRTSAAAMSAATLLPIAIPRSSYLSDNSNETPMSSVWTPIHQPLATPFAGSTAGSNTFLQHSPGKHHRHAGENPSDASHESADAHAHTHNLVLPLGPVIHASSAFVNRPNSMTAAYHSHEEPPKPIRAAIPNTNQYKVLLVDDSASFRKMVVRLLKMENICYSPDEVADGAAALEMLEECVRKNDSYDVVLMDFVMPVMNGPAAVRKARAAGYTGMIVGLTGNALPVDIAEFLDAGANKVLIKPIDRKKLASILHAPKTKKVISPSLPLSPHQVELAIPN